MRVFQCVFELHIGDTVRPLLSAVTCPEECHAGTLAPRGSRAGDFRPEYLLPPGQLCGMGRAQIYRG